MESPAPGKNTLAQRLRRWRLYAMALLTCTGSWMFGFSTGIIGGTIVLPSFRRDFNLAEKGTSQYNNVVANIISFAQIGAMLGSLLVSPIVKRYGRKSGFYVAGSFYVFGCSLQVASVGSLNMLYAGRAICGFGLGSITFLAPMYIAEMSPPSIRGTLVGLTEVNNQISSLLAYWSNYLVNQYVSSATSKQWQITLGMQVVPGGLLLLNTIFIFPESSRYLVEHGHVDKAKKVLSTIWNLPMDHTDIEAEISNIVETSQMQREVGRQMSLMQTLLSNSVRKRLAIGVFLMWGSNLTGINGVNFYTASIFESIGFDGTTFVLVASGIFATVKTLSTFIALFFVIDRAGRKQLLLVATVGATSTLWYLGGFTTATHAKLGEPMARSTAGWVAFVCIYIYAASFSAAWNGVPWIYCSEIFPIQIKELCVSITTANQWLAQFTIARITPYMLSSSASGVFYFVFASCTLVSGFVVWFFVPETKGRSLESMDEIFGPIEVRSRSVV